MSTRIARRDRRNTEHGFTDISREEYARLALQGIAAQAEAARFGAIGPAYYALRSALTKELTRRAGRKALAKVDAEMREMRAGLDVSAWWDEGVAS